MPIPIRYQMALQSMISGNKKYDKNPLLWSADTDHAFVQCKQELANAVLLFHSRYRRCVATRAQRRDPAIGFFLQEVIRSRTQLFRIRSRAPGDLQIDSSFPQVCGRQSFHCLHGSQTTNLHVFEEQREGFSTTTTAY